MPSALVTGGAGFIGSHVARCLVEHDYDVTILDSFVNGRKERIPDGVRVVHEDIRSATAAMLVREGGFDVVCHLAAQIDVRKSVADPVFDAQVNVLGTLNLLEAIRASGRRTRFVFSSTGGAIYGDGVPVPTSEIEEKAPESAYGTSKLAVEHYLSYYVRTHGLDIVTLRYANVYGPAQDGQGEAGVVAIFCERILNAEPLTVYGDGSQTRDYVYVGDVARANLLAARVDLVPASGLDARSFNIATGQETSVLELVAQLAELGGGGVEVRHAPPRPGEQQRSALAIERARAVLGWEPQYPLPRGLADTFAWFASRQPVAVAAAVGD